MTDQNPKTPQTIPDEMAAIAEDRVTKPNQFDLDRSNPASTYSPVKQAEPGRMDLDGDPDIKNSMINHASPPSVSDEESFVGSAPNPSTIQEKDTLDMAHDMDLYPNATEEMPEELDIARQINAAEKAHQQN